MPIPISVLFTPFAAEKHRSLHSKKNDFKVFQPFFHFIENSTHSIIHVYETTFNLTFVHQKICQCHLVQLAREYWPMPQFFVRGVCSVLKLCQQLRKTDGDDVPHRETSKQTNRERKQRKKIGKFNNLLWEVAVQRPILVMLSYESTSIILPTVKLDIG